ncbi:soluble calcium-activated nucleotidase 1-like isoform X2 [Artemia franciscana]|uniref:Apyrase n=1 Tax=Artemia franciscana TaxID=6661 RepID=A0AA88HWU1_ARTSF|nr:hypothetical protein QYM36_006882 [Artemia franciscana]KAK2716539.1 hypothetical protein QYM36_006882 [Artemia franciscana]KAK2716542.1 hypothetical protein QYM36_006882 [Artemia franciscana]
MRVSRISILDLPPHPTMPLETPYQRLEHGLAYHFTRAPVYRIGNTALRIQKRHIFFVFISFLFLVVIYTFFGSQNTNKYLDNRKDYKTIVYESPYPLTPPVRTERGLKYKFGIISDLDTSSLSKDVKNTWLSYLKAGYLTVDIPAQKAYIEIESGSPIVLSSNIASGGRGMELSELVVFDGNVMTFDDRTGIVYVIEGKTAYPWVILTDGPGKVSKGFKSEWATVKDGYLYVGGLGKVWTNSKGETVNHFPQWVKSVSPKGHVKHHDWQMNYEALAKAVDIQHPGYLIHEACAWSDIKRKWVFLPRRESKEAYNEEDDENRGTNLMLITDEDFSDVEVKRVGTVTPTHGFSSLKFIPGTNDEWIVALKSEETNGKTSTYALVFNMDGHIILPETQVSAEHKFEGIEFL